MSKSYKLYAKGWIDNNGYIHDFTELKDVLQNILEIDKKIEDLSIEHKNINSQLDYDESRITNLEELTDELNQTIGKDEGENDTNLDDIQSKLATHSSNIAAMKLDISSNKSTLNSLNNKVTTINNDLTEIKNQISQLNANITAIMTSLNNKLDKTHASTLTVPTFNSSTFELTGFYSDIMNKDVDTYLNDVSKWIGAMMSALQGKY